jgi:DNA-binding PadR family transcriptional regulator
MQSNEIDLMFLGLLMQGPAHGYELMRRIAISFGTQYPNPNGSVIYPRLARFEKEGLVTCKVEEQQGVPNKKVYSLTEAGYKRVKELVATPIQMSGKMSDAYGDELTIHIVFFGLITKEERRKVIEPFYKLALYRYDDAKQKMDKYQTGLDKYSLTLLRYGAQLLKLYIEMFKEIMEIDDEPIDMDVLLQTLHK